MVRLESRALTARMVICVFVASSASSALGQSPAPSAVNVPARSLRWVQVFGGIANGSAGPCSPEDKGGGVTVGATVGANVSPRRSVGVRGSFFTSSTSREWLALMAVARFRVSDRFFAVGGLGSLSAVRRGGREHSPGILLGIEAETPGTWVRGFVGIHLHIGTRVRGHGYEPPKSFASLDVGFTW